MERIIVDEILTQLSNLKDLYRQRRVSVLVGAGFSKNVSPVFPLWDELLYDMVLELYKDEIEISYLRFRELHPGKKASQEYFQQSEVPRILSREGSLNIVSRYIKKRGYRESIEQYIEERVPYIDVKNNQFRFSGNNASKVIDINPDYFSAHVKLIKGSCWERMYTTNYDRLLEYAAEMSDLKINTITQAHKLSVYCDDPTIIKLHGDLYNPLEAPRIFRFDGNCHQQYIISEEDYRNYPRDHEAFTQLMRISLLQGYFCLIGFSGDDPNFVNWIEWVREILVKDDVQDNGQENKKIFLIGLSTDLPQSYRRIFYDNHKVAYIPLLSDEVMLEIGANAEESPREVFVHFFDYLYPQKEREMAVADDGKGPKDVISPDEIASRYDKISTGGSEDNEDSQNKEDEDRKEYQHLWNSVYEEKINGTPPHFTRTLIVNEDKLARLRQIKIWNRFVNNSDQQKIYLEIIISKENLTVPEAQLAILALRDSGITVTSKMAKLISESGVENEDLIQFQKLNDRTYTLYQAWVDRYELAVDPYESIIRQLFSLNFSASKQLIKEWHAEGVDILKKAFLLSFFMEDGAKELIVEFLKSESNAKERYYATRFLNMVEGTFPPVHSLARYENANVQNYFEVISNYTKRVKEEKVKIGRYGDGRNDKTTFMDYKASKVYEAMAVLNFLIEAPCFVSFRNFYILVNIENWYPIHRNLFELFPYASLFYSLQCSDKKVIARIGQDYAYSDILAQSSLGEVLLSLLTASVSNDTPSYLKESILQFSKELFVAVPSSKWEGHFMQDWDEMVMSSRFNQTEARRYDTLDGFIYKGLNSLKNKLLRQRIICDVLMNSKKDTTFVINCLYYLCVVKADGEGDERLSRVVDDFISQLSLPEEITIAGNIYRLLTETQKEAISSKCIEILNVYIGKIDEVVFRSAQFFVKDSVEGRRVFVAAVCESPLLWKNGVGGNNVISSFNYLSITSLVRRIYIDKETLLFIYKKMIVSLNDLVAFFDSNKTVPFLGNVDGLLTEMLSFLNYYKKSLLSQDDYEEVRNKVKSYHQEISGLIEMEDGLLSPYEDELKKSLNFIYNNRGTIAHKDVMRYVSMIVGRVLMKNSDGLDTCIAYLRLYLNEGIVKKDDRDVLLDLVRLLDRLTKDVAQECNMELVMTTRDMAKIAKVLSRNGYASKGIEYWIKLHKSGRFYTNFD